MEQQQQQPKGRKPFFALMALLITSLFNVNLCLMTTKRKLPQRAPKSIPIEMFMDAAEEAKGNIHTIAAILQCDRRLIYTKARTHPELWTRIRELRAAYPPVARKQHANQEPEYTVEEIISGIEDSGGIFVRACEIIGCSRNELKWYMNTYPEVAEAMENARENMVDLVEEAMIERASKDTLAGIFILKNNRPTQYGDTKKEDTAIREIRVTINPLQVGDGRSNVTSFSALPTPVEEGIVIDDNSATDSA